MYNKLIIAFILMLSISSMSINAQESSEVTNKNDVPILPKAGEIGLGFNAVPIFNFIGNTFNANTSNTYMGDNKFASNLGQNVIFGKYMLEDDKAVRAHIRIGSNNSNFDNYVWDDTKNSPDSLVTDTRNLRTSTVVIGGGYEMRKGRGRVQGFYGADAFVMFQRASESFSYGNDYTITNASPTSTNFNSMTADPMSSRVVSTSGGNGFGVGVRPFIGVEYFIAPQVSLGGEFGWMIMYNRFSESVTTSEYFDTASETVMTTESLSAGNRSFALDTDNFNGAIFLMFYF